MPLAGAISRGAFLKARLGVNGIQNDSRSLGTAVATASLLACAMKNLPDELLARERPEPWPRYSSRRAEAKSPRRLRHAPDCRPLMLALARSESRVDISALKLELPRPGLTAQALPPV